MESKDNNNRSEDASKGIGETGDSAVKNECCDKKKADDSEHVVEKEKNDEKKKEEPVKNGNVPVDAGNAVEKDNKNVDIVTCDKKKNAANNSPNNEKQEKIVDKSVEVIVQKPKRTKSRRSLNKMYSTNNIDVAINDNASIQRTDR